MRAIRFQIKWHGLVAFDHVTFLGLLSCTQLIVAKVDDLSAWLNFHRCLVQNKRVQHNSKEPNHNLTYFDRDFHATIEGFGYATSFNKLVNLLSLSNISEFGD